MERLVVVLAVVVVAVVVARLLSRRPADVPTQPRAAVPTQLDRADFPEPEKPWLVAVFTSETCLSCAQVLPKAEVLASDQVAVAAVSFQGDRALHERYAIDIVPLTVVAGPDGGVRASFIGTPSATDLWAAVAEARSPGTSPEPDLGRPAPSADG